MIHPSIPDSTIRKRGFLSWESTISITPKVTHCWDVQEDDYLWEPPPDVLFFRAMTRKGAARKAIDAYIWESHPWE